MSSFCGKRYQLFTKESNSNQLLRAVLVYITSIYTESNWKPDKN